MAYCIIMVIDSVCSTSNLFRWSLLYGWRVIAVISGLLPLTFSWSSGYPQQVSQGAYPPPIVQGTFDQGARFDPNKPVSVPVSFLD